MATVPKPYIPNVLRFRLWFNLQAGYQGGVGHYWQYSGGPPAIADVSAFCVAIRTAFGTHLASFMSDDFSLFQVTGRDLSSEMGAEGVDVTTITGGDSNPMLGIDTAALVNMKVGRNYRGGRPRIYWPFGTNTSLENTHNWTDAFVSALNAAILAYATEISGQTSGGTTLEGEVNVSYYYGFNVVTNPVTGRTRNVPVYRGPTGKAPVIDPDPILSYNTSKALGSQRRRVKGTGG